MSSSKSWAATSVAFSLKVIKAFFGIRDEDSSLQTSKKVAGTVFNRILYSLADYWLVAVSAVFIITMDKQFDPGLFGLFLLMWAFDMVIASAFVIIWKRTGIDVTLGESYRRAADAIYSGSRRAGQLAILSVVVKATFWDGPEHIVIFFNKEIKTGARIVLALTVLTALQAAIWTPVFVLGFDSVAELFNHVTNNYFSTAL